MRPTAVPVTVLLFIFASLLLQASSAEDLYWEGEEDASNEFLEVKDEDIGFTGHLKRLKRQLDFNSFFSAFSGFSSSTTEAPSALESATDDSEVDAETQDEELDHGSGQPDRGVEQDLGEKTLRVTFVVMEPYQMEYSNRDSEQFLNFSRSIADAVNLLYENLPGTQKASLVRIQSRISDEFSCKVTLDIVTVGYDDLDRISQILHDHIRNRRELGSVTVNDADFSANPIDPGLSSGCSVDEIRCGDDSCVPGTARCNGSDECPDGADEIGCNFFDNIGQDVDQVTSGPDCNQIRCAGSSLVICDYEKCNGIKDCPDGDDELGCDDSTAPNRDEDTTPAPVTTFTTENVSNANAPNCPEGMFPCDETRCLLANQQCDNVRDCYDGADEMGCDNELCGADDFFCSSNGKCIEGRSRCNGVKECPNGEDEQNCSCREDEFQCVSDRSCIQERKKCDGVPHCSDSSDERDCAPPSCPPDAFACRFGLTMVCARRCDGLMECDRGEDEEDCNACSHECDGICLEEERICNGYRDCSDGSDELNCDQCDRPDDFRCKSGECINILQHCNGIFECPDNSDELDCNTTLISKPSDGCSVDEYQCNDGTCINSSFYCDGRNDCLDNSDEDNCQCNENQFQCDSGPCIPISAYCDGHPDCSDSTDEFDCPSTQSWITTTPGRVPDVLDISTSRPIFKDPAEHPRPGQGTSYNGERPGSGYDRPESGSTPGYRPGEFSTSRPGDNFDRPSQGNQLGNERPDYERPGQGGYFDGNRPDSEFGAGGDDFGNNLPDSDFNRPDQNGDRFGPGSNRPAQGTDRPGGEFDNNLPESGYNQPGYDNNRPGYDNNRPGYDNNRPGYDNNRPGYDNNRPGYDNNRPGYDNNRPGYDNNRPGYDNNGPGFDNRPGQGGDFGGVRPGDNNIPSSGFDRPGSVDYSGSNRGPNGDDRGPIALNLKTYPPQQTVRNVPFGGDVVFQCRDEGPLRTPVRWARPGGQPLKAGALDKNGRLEMNNVTASDSGVYICQAIRYIGHPNSELRVTLTVEPYTPAASPVQFSCLPHEATCANGQCIPKSAVCNYVFDCADRSDEDACHVDGKCEPNQFKCKNNKCVLKTWLCDSEDDCGDGSDESDCGYSPYGQCKTVEFTCASGDQCVPKSFHCDGHSDCFDGSDEIGCVPVYVTQPPRPSNLRLNVGDTLTLNCSATGTPTPLISWRRNWGDVPEVCTTENIPTNGQVVGILVCPNMQAEYNGAYSCEAMNNKGTTFAIPDAIVFVNKTSVCPIGYFNSEARSERECIRCFCFGESTSCRSADLFTYNMPTPLGEGGTRLVGVKNAASGDIQLDTSGITNQYYYQPLRNGATVTKLARFGSSWGTSSALPYLTLPETYNGNQLTSYGGHIKYKLAPHLSSYGSDNGLPDVIIKGKYQNLLHFNRGSSSVVEARLTPENWQKHSPRGLMPASREDIMMALDNIEMILLRASVNNAGVNITEFVMESAHHINTGLGAASLVEECSCPPGYEGLSCQKCASGFAREQSGPWLGNCVPERPTCPAGTYGDPSSGYACRPCPCPLVNRENQFATSCAIASDGNVVCDCPRGYSGRNCEYCDAGYVGNPLVVGDSCRPAPQDRCNPEGTSRVRLPDECECKDNVQGRYCDQCKNHSFFLSKDFRQGCALCFCSGVSQECRSSNLRRKTTTVRFNTPDLVNRVKIYSSTPLGAAAAIRYNAPVETNLTASYARDELVLANFDRNRPAIYYWSLPIAFAGDKVTSYGGHLTYTLRNVPVSGAFNSKNNAADVQLISENHLTFHYFGNFEPSYDGTLKASVQFLERGWQRPDGKEESRENFLLALADVKAILVKATYTNNEQLASLVAASIETADENGDGPAALHVEQCICPRGYIGTSCEDCAPGYTRYASGLYLEHCGPCECNGNSNMCHAETGVCSDCQNNTTGDNCELCKPGYRRDQDNYCVPDYSPQPSDCDPRGSTGRRDDRGLCECKENVEGRNCDTCRVGTFGLDANNPLGCYACYCSGATTNCHDASSQYIRVPMAAPVFGDNYGGYTLMDVNAQRTIIDHIVSMPTESELMYVFSFPPDEELYWSLPVFPGNRVLSYGGTLQLKQKFESQDENTISEPGTDVILVGDDKSLYWTNPQPIQAKIPLAYKVPLTEQGWFLLNYATPASRSDMLSVLRSLRRVLVRATLARNIDSSSIADVSMDTATDMPDPGFPPATGVEVCMCPDGYSGTSCESCTPGYYKDQFGCQQCSCNGFNCHMSGGQVVCDCQPPYTGNDCSILADSSKHDNGTTRPPPPRTTVVVQITSPTIKIQDIGSTVNFTCQAQSRMTRGNLPVTWLKDDGYLPQGRSYVDERIGMLTITNLQVSDSGKYICQTSDGISTAQAIATLKVPGNDMTLPSVEIRPPINDYFEGERIQLECIARGNPAPVVTWQRGSGRALPPYAEVIDELFIIENAREEDSGEYRCIVSNALGSSDRVAVVNVRPRPAQPIRDKLTVSQASPTINEGQNTRVACTGTANVPAGTIDWVRQDGTQLPSNVRSVNGVLYIDTAKLDNQGVYICQTSSYDVAPVLVVVTVIPQGTPSPDQQPNITVSSDSLRIPTGGSGAVDCNPRGYPQPLIRWRKYEGQFGEGTSQRQNTLIITNAQESDQGYYLCEGTVDGQPVANIYVYVDIEKREKPQIEIWPQGEQAVTLGSPFSLRCRVMAGIPEPDVTWNRGGGRSLSPLAQLQPNNILSFERIDVNDEGEYSCTASNVAGTATASATIKVRAPPEVTVSPSNDVQALVGDPVTVECRASGYPQPLVSIRTDNDQREIVPPNPGMAVLHISSVSYRDEGYYTCSATSAAGTIEEQFDIRVDRGDGGIGVDEGSGDINIDPGYPSGNDQVRDLIAVEGQETRIVCDASSALDVQWSRADRRPLQPNAQQNRNYLVIRGTSKQDQGEYVCNLIDRFTGEVVKSATTSLVVMAAPRIVLQPPTQTVHPGESPTVECVVGGDEIQDIIWRPLTRPFSNRVEVRHSTLIFNRIEVEDAGQYECFAKNRVANTSATAEVLVSGPPEESPAIASIEQPRRQFRVGENVEVLCRAKSRGVRVSWERYGTRQYVESRTFGDGALLVVNNVQESDAGRYRCTGTDRFGRTSVDDFNLEVQPGSPVVWPEYPPNDLVQFTVRQGESIEMPCNHNLEPPFSFEWRREYTPLQPDVRSSEPSLHLEHITEADAGTYVCRVSNSRTAVESRAVLRVAGVVPRFDGGGWISLPTLQDAYRQFDIEVSFKPIDNNGLILYNSEKQDRSGDYLALQLVQGVPQLLLDTGAGPVEVNGDRPLQLNTWHTVRISKTNSKIIMAVDNLSPTTVMMPAHDLLELRTPLYIGGVPDFNQLPGPLALSTGFIGCVSMLVLGNKEKNIMLNRIEQSNILECDSCNPNQCSKNGVCQEARNERGYICLCAPGFGGLNCDRTGDACRPGLCGPGKCTDTADGYKCACPVRYTGKNCDMKQNIEYPAFTGSAYLAIKAPKSSRIFKMSMKVKAASPVSDGIIMYSAESPLGYGGFTALTVHNGKLEFIYDLGDGSRPVILTSNRTLPVNEWTDVYIVRVGPSVTLTIDLQYNFEDKLMSNNYDLNLETPMFVGGADESIVLNKNIGVTGGFKGCIKDVMVFGNVVDIVGASIQSANVQECSNYDRGDIPEVESVCSQCRNGAECTEDGSACICPYGYTGRYCESGPIAARRPPGDPCVLQPCRNGGTCRRDYESRLNYSCDCPLGFAGTNCQMPLELRQSVAFVGNGYIELPASQLRYDLDAREPVVIAMAFYTDRDGVLLYQREMHSPHNAGDFILIRIENGLVIMDWDLGGGLSSVYIEDVYVIDSDRHLVIVKLYKDGTVNLMVDSSSKNASSTGFSNVMNADSNIYVGGIPDALNVNRYPGFSGCVEQIELMGATRGINLGQEAVAGRNTQRCKKPRSG